MHFDLTNPPKIALKFFSKFRKWKLGRYKKRKVRKEKAKRDRAYFVKFKIIIEDPINPQKSDMEYEMIVPAKAAFFAKKKTEMSIKKKLSIEFIDCEIVTEEELEEFESSKDEYVKNLEEIEPV